MTEDIEEKRMPLLDHLVELRSRLIYSFVAFIVAFSFVILQNLFSRSWSAARQPDRGRTRSPDDLCSVT